MKKIKEFVEEIDEELESAMEYAEKYVEYKAKGDAQIANKFKEMSNDELRHSMFLHELAVKEIEEISKVFTAPIEMQEAWDKAHKGYTAKAAHIKQMLSL